MPGPMPTPTPLKLIRGNPGKRPLNKHEPRAERGAPKCPPFLNREAKQEWRNICARLEGMGLLYHCDRALIAAWCEAWSEFAAACADVETHGRISERGSGGLMPHPAIEIKNQAAKRLLQLAQQFGFSPAARTRIKAEETQTVDPFEAAFLKQNEECRSFPP